MNFYLILPYENILSFVNNNYGYYILTIVLFLLQVSLVLLYLIDFKLSFVNYVKSIFIFFSIGVFIYILFIYFLFLYDNIALPNIICSVGDINNNIGTHVNTNVNINDKEAGQS
jgi:hypothetical protein